MPITVRAHTEESRRFACGNAQTYLGVVNGGHTSDGLDRTGVASGTNRALDDVDIDAVQAELVRQGVRIF